MNQTTRSQSACFSGRQGWFRELVHLSPAHIPSLGILWKEVTSPEGISGPGRSVGEVCNPQTEQNQPKDKEGGKG